MAAALIAQMGPHPRPLDIHNQFAKTAPVGRRKIHQFDFPAHFVGVAMVHIVQVADKQGCFFAACAGPQFHNNRADRRIIRHHQGVLDFFEQDLLFLLQFINLGLSQFLQFRFGGGVSRQRTRLFLLLLETAIPPEAADNRRQFALLFGERNKPSRIGRHRRLRNLLFNLPAALVQLLKFAEDQIVLLCRHSFSERNEDKKITLPLLGR